MRILIVTETVPYPPVGGHKIPTYYLIRGLAERGHAITLLAAQDSDEQPVIDKLQDCCEKVIVVPGKRPSLSSYVWRSFPFVRNQLNKELQKHFLALTEAERFEVIHYDSDRAVQYGRNVRTQSVEIVGCRDAFSLMLERRRKTEHNILKKAYAELRRREFLFMERRLYPQKDAVIVVSPEDQQYLQKLLAAPIYSVPNGVDSEHFAFDRSHETANRLLFVGHYGSPANRDAVMWFIRDVYRQLYEKYPHVRFHVVGPESERISIPEELGHSALLRGYVANLVEEYHAAQIFVSPLRYGAGIKNKILEAFSTGLPVVATDVSMEGFGAMDEQHYLKANTPDEFVRQIGRLLIDVELRRRLRMNARRLVDQKFSIDQMVSGYEAIYQTLMQKKGLLQKS